MTFPKHIKIVFRGEFANTPEIWSFGIKVDPTATADPDAEVTDISETAVKSALQAFLPGNGFGSAVVCTGWRAYTIGPDGKMEGNPKVVEYAVGNRVAGDGTAKLPPQCAVVVTTVAVNRGPARYGRFYLPMLGLTIANDLRLSAGDQTNVINPTVTFLKAISDAVDMPGSLASAELVNVSGVGGGTRQQVDHIRVGRVIDTHRSRRNQLDEAYADSGHIDW